MASLVRRAALGVVVLGTAIGLTGCGTAAAGGGASSAAASNEIAYLNFSVVNVYDKPIQDAAQKVADSNGLKMTVFDAEADGSKQYSQLENVITSGKYSGVVIQAVQSTNLVPLIKQAIAAKIGVVIVDQVVGSDLSTNEPQVKGIVASVAIPPVQVGERLGKLAIQACAEKGTCDAGFIYGYKGSVTDNGLALGFASAIKSSDVKLVAEAQGLYTTPGGLQAAQDLLTSTPGLNVLIGADQSIVGAEQAISDAGKTGKISLIGYDGSSTALKRIASGAWFGGVQYPQKTEGRLAMKALADYLKTGKKAGAINVIDQLPADDLITKSTVSKFSSQDDAN